MGIYYNGLVRASGKLSLVKMAKKNYQKFITVHGLFSTTLENNIDVLIDFSLVFTVFTPSKFIVIHRPDYGCIVKDVLSYWARVVCANLKSRRKDDLTGLWSRLELSDLSHV